MVVFALLSVDMDQPMPIWITSMKPKASSNTRAWRHDRRHHRGHYRRLASFNGARYHEDVPWCADRHITNPEPRRRLYRLALNGKDSLGQALRERFGIIGALSHAQNVPL